MKSRDGEPAVGDCDDTDKGKAVWQWLRVCGVMLSRKPSLESQFSAQHELSNFGVSGIIKVCSCKQLVVVIMTGGNLLNCCDY